MTVRDLIKKVGAPDPEQNTSPIFDWSDDEFLSLDRELERGICYFNNLSFELGDYVCSGNELLRCDEKGVWVRHGTCYPEEVE